ncbi:MAG TPA: hypothetical protein P5218_10290, partial [Planctomycetota bacterium]|nr:hypothetical protein [Planctomycetota bacterium]
MALQPSLRAEDVIAWADAHWGQTCRCGSPLVGQDAVLSLLLGHKQAPRCVPCLARHLGEEPAALVTRSLAHMQRLHCYRAGWEHSERRMAREGLAVPAWLLRGATLESLAAEQAPE